jgi:hypothetical protein
MAYSAPAGSLGLGLILGDHIGPNLKYWLTNQQAINAGVGFDDDPVFYAEYLWHNWRLLPQPSRFRLSPYMGLGPRFEFRDDGENDMFGIRVPLGLTFLLDSAPLELFAELVPVFELSPNTDSDLDGGIGVRLYFSGPQGWEARG